ncbi:hypothetical protein NC651_037493 [Populus alba x Populus x berolinensis]|nr:hypothetical protein NC651_037493 [Populus alba x Populus x berolinensis]
MLGLALAAFILAAKATTLASAASLVTFIFGDSLTEVGNNKYLQYSLARSDYPWYGIDFPGGKATGRFTNGMTVGDRICFKISNTSCCNVDTTIGGLCLPNSKLCSNRKDYVFWDAFHPSDAANASTSREVLFHPVLRPAICGTNTFSLIYTSAEHQS